MNITGIEKYLRKYFLRNYRLRGLDYTFEFEKDDKKKEKVYVIVTPIINLYDYFFDEDGKYSPQVVKDNKLSTQTLMKALSSFVSNIKFNKLKVHGRPKAVKKLTEVIGKKIDDLAEERDLPGVTLNKVKINARIKTNQNVIRTNSTYGRIYFANPLSNLRKGNINISLNVPFSYKHKMKDVGGLRRDALSSLSLEGDAGDINFYESDIKNEVTDLSNEINNNVKKLYDEYNVKLIDYKIKSKGLFPLKINDKDYVPYKNTYDLHHTIELDINKLNKYNLNFDPKYYEFFRRKNFSKNSNLLEGLTLYKTHNDTLIYLGSIQYKMINRNKQQKEREKFEDLLKDITENFLTKNNIPYDYISMDSIYGPYNPPMKVSHMVDHQGYGNPITIKTNLTLWVNHLVYVEYNNPTISIIIPQNKQKEEYTKELSLSIVETIIERFPYLNKSDVRVYFREDI